MVTFIVSPLLLPRFSDIKLVSLVASRGRGLVYRSMEGVVTVNKSKEYLCQPRTTKRLASYVPVVVDEVVGLRVAADRCSIVFACWVTSVVALGGSVILPVMV